jgi:hypothetical protein
MKKILYVCALMGLCLALMTSSASAMVEYSGYAQGCQGYNGGYNSAAVSVCPGYNTGNTGGGYGYGGGYGCGVVAPNRYPEYCTKWIPGHWIQVRVMMPGKWVYRPVWIPSYPKTQYKWVAGFWQTTARNVRPDLQIWGSPNTGWYGRPYQQQTGGTGGYFNPQGVWIPTAR